jgi:phosphoribosylaminoimidazole carboxylase PurE protein
MKKNTKKDFLGSAKVAIIMGSKTDYTVMKNAEEALSLFSIPFETEIVSAHRTPEKMQSFAKSAKSRGIKIIIAGAGGAAHLPGMVASLTSLPVIGVPVSVNILNGLDSLLSIVQMPSGVPVATMAIDNAFNAGLLVARILAINDKNLSQQLELFSDEQIKKVGAMNAELKKNKK